MPQRESDNVIIERTANQIISVYETEEKILAYCDRMIEHQKDSMYYEMIKDLIIEKLAK